MSGSSAGTVVDEHSMRWQGFVGRCVIALAVVGTFVATTCVLVDRTIDARVAKIRRVKLSLADSPPGGANYLVIGSDTRAFVKNAEDAAAFGDPNGPDAAGQRSDTLMVAHVEPGSQKTFVVSFPRDLMVDVPGVPGKSRINSAYSIGGPQLVADTLKFNFDIDINHYLEVDFKSFEAIVDEIGNVTVYIPGKSRDQETGLSTPYGGGCYTLDGPNALAYVRSRHIEIADPRGEIVDDFPPYERWRKLDDWSDLSRIARQQSFIRKLAGLAISKSLSDPFLAVSLTNNVLKYLKADQSLNRDDVNALVRAFRTVDVNDPSSVRFETLPVAPDPNNPNVTVVPSRDAEQTIEALRTFGDNTPKPATVQPAQVTVRVADATGTNVLPSVVKALAEQGFKVSQSPIPIRKVPVTEIRYGYGQAEEAKALLAYITDAKLVPDPKAKDGVELVLGSSFLGRITVPSTSTTAPPVSTAPGPATTAPPTTTIAPTPAASDPCPQ